MHHKVIKVCGTKVVCAHSQEALSDMGVHGASVQRLTIQAGCHCGALQRGTQRALHWALTTQTFLITHVLSNYKHYMCLQLQILDSEICDQAIRYTIV